MLDRPAARTARSRSDRTPARGSFRHCWRHRGSTGLSRRGDLCAGNRPGTTDWWRGGQKKTRRIGGGTKRFATVVVMVTRGEGRRRRDEAGTAEGPREGRG